MSGLPPSPQTTLGILLGASAWPNAPTLKGSLAFSRSAHKVRDYFLHSGPFKMPQENWKDLFDTSLGSFNEIDQEIGDFLDDRLAVMEQMGTPARDLIVYYIGHGAFAFDQDQAYHLTIRRTRDENLRASAIPFAALSDTLKSKARRLRRFIILDCCFAAASVKHLQSAGGQVAFKQAISALGEKSKSTGRGLPHKGTALLASSGQDEASLYFSNESGTMFSEALIRTLRRGNADQPEKSSLSIDDLKGGLIDTLEKISQGKAPLPKFYSPDQSEGDVASVPLFPNPQARTKRKQVGALAHPSGPISQKIRQKWLKEGNSIRDPKRSAEALIAIEQALRQHPNDAVAYYAKGYTLNDLKRPKEALAIIEHAIRLDPNIADFYKGKGNALLDLKRYKEALEAYEQAIYLNPNYAFVYTNKGVVLNALKMREKALAAFEQAIRLDPNEVIAYYNKGLTLKYLKRNEKALAAFEQAISLDPHYAAAYSEKGLVLNALKMHEKALKAIEQAIRLDSHSAVAYNYKSIILDSLNRDEEALEAIEQALLIDPTSTLAYFGKGCLFGKAERYEEALINYEKAIYLDPNSALSYYNKSVVLGKLKRDEEALAAYEQAIRLDPSLEE